MSIKLAGLAAAFALLAASGVNAQDAMSTDAMAPDSMAPMMSEDDLASCVEQSKAITFPDVAMAAEHACHNLHNGHDAMEGGAMGGDAMGADSMSSGGAM